MNDQVKKILPWAIAGGASLLAIQALVRYRRTISLERRAVMITGGSRGLGLVIAREFARHGARIALCARDDDELDRAASDLAGRGAHVITVCCDVSRQDSVDQAVRTVMDEFGEIDILVNNAGIIQVGPFEDMNVEDFEAALQTNMWGALYTTLAVLPGMRERRMGRIVNISSIGGAVSAPHLLPYGVSKFAIRGLSEGLRAELGKYGILVTTVLPGLMRTGSPINALFKGHHRAEHAIFSISDSIPLLSVSAEMAASQIVSACRHGDAELVISLPAKLAAAFHGLFPGLTADILGLVDRFLPGPGGTRENIPGRDSKSALSPSILTKLSDDAAHRNNELKLEG